MRRAGTVLALLLVLPAAGASVSPSSLEFADGTYVISQPIHVPPGARLTFRDATVYIDHRGDVPAITVDAGASLEIVRSRVTTSRPGGWVVSGHAARLVVVDSDLSGYGAIAFQLPGARSSVTRSTFHDAVGPVAFVRGAEANVAGNAFHDVSAGLAVRDSSSVIAGNRFENVAGRAIDVQATLLGERALATLPRIEGNTVEHAGVGLLVLNGYPNLVADNAFRNSTVGMSIGILGGEAGHAEAPIVRGNLFEGNVRSVYVAVVAYGAKATNAQVVLAGSRFLSSACEHVVAAPPPAGSVLTVDARGAWWGSADGPVDAAPGCPAARGLVLVSPWATSP